MNRKLISFIIAGAMVLPTVTAFADTNTNKETSQTAPVSATENPEIKTERNEGVSLTANQFIGIVKKVDDTSVTVDVKTEDDVVETNFVITDKTVICNLDGENVTIKEKDTVIVATYSELFTKDIKEAVAVIADNTEEGKERSISFIVDTFKADKETIVNSDNSLVLNIEGDTSKYDNKELLVFFSFMTMSIPAQTNPLNIIVLGDGRAADESPADEDPQISTDPTEENENLEANQFGGVVKSVDDKSVTVEITTEDQTIEVNFVLTDKTAIYDLTGEEAEIKVGDKVDVATYSELLTKDIKEAAAVIINNTKEGEERSVGFIVDSFRANNDGIVNSSGSLILNIEGDASQYDNKELLVFYSFMTLSLPAQTNPIKIVVLGDGRFSQAPVREDVEISFKVGDSILNINGENVEVETPYVVGEGVTLVPLRVITEAFGAIVNWDEATKGIDLEYFGKKIHLQIDNKTAVVDEKETELEEAPELTNGFTMVPLRFISETFGAEVGYDEATRGITVSLKAE